MNLLNNNVRGNQPANFNERLVTDLVYLHEIGMALCLSNQRIRFFKQCMCQDASMAMVWLKGPSFVVFLLRWHDGRQRPGDKGQQKGCRVFVLGNAVFLFAQEQLETE